MVQRKSFGFKVTVEGEKKSRKILALERAQLKIEQIKGLKGPIY